MFTAAMRRLPLWARMLLGADRYALRGFRAYEILRDHLLLGRLDPALHPMLTARAYANERAAYLPGGARFEAGLFDWEAMVLERLELRRGARILLAAAGGGRELAALLALGHEVVAFEPNEALLAGANAVAAKAAAAPVLRASLEHLIESVLAGTGPLAGVAGPFELVLLGWVSLSHITEPRTQIALLRAIRRLSPKAPVVASFLVRAAGSRSAIAYMPRAGVVYRFSPDEIGRLASESGYAVGHLDTTRDGYAIFEPFEATVARRSE
jgi:SAM-dependent methyltransferase